MSDPKQPELPLHLKAKPATTKILAGFDRTFMAFEPVYAMHQKGTPFTGTYRVQTQTYKTEKTALRYGGIAWLNDARRASGMKVVPPLVVRFRPDELEPVNMPPADRIVFYKRMIDTWCERLFAAGLDLEEVAVVAEAIMLDMEVRMKAALAREAL